MKQQIPWNRFAVESVVIVGSILLAFAIDAAWESRVQQRQHADYLRVLEGEFNAAKVELLDHIETRQKQLDQIDNILGAIDRNHSIDEVRLPWITALFIYTPSHPVLSDLANSSSIDILDSDQLRYLLFEYKKEFDFSYYVSDLEKQFTTSAFTPFLTNRIDYALVSNPWEIRGFTYEPGRDSGLEEIQSDREFWNLLLRKRGLVRWGLGIEKSILEILDKIV